MKKILLSAFFLTAFLGNITVSGQEQIELQKNDNLANSKTNLHNGVPEIGLPLLSVSALSNINIGVQLSYSTEAISSHKMISDVGQGWGLQYGGRIFKSDTKNVNDYRNGRPSEVSSDVYFYSFLGNTGRFYISKEEGVNGLLTVQLQPSKNKITVEKDNTQEGKIRSFTITDENGNSYLFDKINIDKYRFGIMDPSIEDMPANTKITNTSFALSKITNNRNQEVATFEYETTTKVMDHIGTLQDNKIKKININDYGSIVFVYKPNSSPYILGNKGDRDWYQMDRLVLKDKNNKVINQYAFINYGVFLIELRNLDTNDNIIQRYFFDYNKPELAPDEVLSIDRFGYPNIYNPCSLDDGVLMQPHNTNPETATVNSLKSIILPTGGRIEYEFESHSIEETRSDSDDRCQGYICSENYDLDKIYTLDFDSRNPNFNYNLNFTGDYEDRLFVKFSYSLYSYPPPKPEVSNEIEYYLDSDNGILTPQPYIHAMNSFPCSSIQFFNSHFSGFKKFLFSGPSQGYGKVEFYALKNTRRHKNTFGYGLRIKSIKNFDADTNTPTRWTAFEYNKFSDPLTSSGEVIDEDLSGRARYSDVYMVANKSVGYSNVKMINKLENTYTKYSFYNSNEISNLRDINYSFIDLAGYLKRRGLIKQKEVYGTGNILLQESTQTYEPEIVTLNNVKYQGQPVKKLLIKKEIQTIKDYTNGNSQPSISSIENHYENQFNNLVYSKETLFDGTVIEKNIQYAKEKNIQKMINANLVGIPLMTEVKRNGTVVGKSETRLDDPSTLYPTSVLTFDQQNQNTAKKITFDKYDDKGNIREARAENGIPYVTVWGYHQTLPIIKIIGATYSEIAGLGTITAAISSSDADDNDPSHEAALIHALDNVRKDPALKNHQIETSTYDPLIGITSKTASNGIRETYVYDAANRLSKVLDKDGNVINKYDYHYAPPIYGNKEWRKEYKNQTCSIGNFPNTYQYKVPANTYFSFVSVSDANQMASQDVLANGQNAANQYAGCTPMACTVTKGYDIATLSSTSLTMQNSNTLRLQMSFPYDSSLLWAIGQAVGKINGNCTPDIRRNISYGNWKITIYSNGNVYAQLTTGSSSIPDGTMVNFDVTFPKN
jgi:hypothetical protein